MLPTVLSWPKSLFRFFCKMSWKAQMNFLASPILQVYYVCVCAKWGVLHIFIFLLYEVVSPYACWLMLTSIKGNACNLHLFMLVKIFWYLSGYLELFFCELSSCVPDPFFLLWRLSFLFKIYISIHGCTGSWLLRLGFL